MFLKMLRTNRQDISYSFLVIGLGNPGKKYEKTRHNAGFLVLNMLSQKLAIKTAKKISQPYQVGKGAFSGSGILLVKPLTFMNRSGEILPNLQKQYNIDSAEIFVCVDNMDLPPGEIRIKKGGGHAGHNGLRSILTHMTDRSFVRVYIGVGRPAEGETVIDHVLGDPQENEMHAYRQGIEKAVNAIISCLAGTRIEKVMNEYNRKNASTES